MNEFFQKNSGKALWNEAELLHILYRQRTDVDGQFPQLGYLAKHVLHLYAELILFVSAVLFFSIYISMLLLLWGQRLSGLFRSRLSSPTICR